MTDIRKKVIDHSPIFWEHHVVVIVNPAEMLNWMTFISPLEFHSWLAVGVTIVVCSVVLALSGHLLEGEFRKEILHLYIILFYLPGNEEFWLQRALLFSSTCILFMRLS